MTESKIEQKRVMSAASLADVLQRNYFMLLIIVGYTLLCFPFNWGLTIASSQHFARPFDFNMLIDFGEIVGFCAALAIVFVAKPPLWRLVARVVPFVALAVGNVVIALYALEMTSGSAAVAGDACMGFGYALGLVVWLDRMSQLLPRKMLIVLSIGFLFNLISYPIIAEIQTSVSCAYAVVSALGSAVLLLAVDATNKSSNRTSHFQGESYSLGASDSHIVLSTKTTSEQPHSRAQRTGKPASRNLRLYYPPRRLIAFAAIIPFAFGFCTSFLNIGVSSIGLKLGFALPAIIIIVGMLFCYDRFNLTSVYWITCPLMTIGLLSSFFLSLSPTISKVLITAALASVHLVIYMVVRVQSQELERVPLFAYALLNMLVVVFTLFGKETERLLQNTFWEPYLMIGLIMAVVLSYGLIIASSNGKGSFNIGTMLSEETERNHVMKLAQDHGLSKRETSVYALLLDDKTVSEIAAELFIAPSTVRAHTSRIYEKFDVHTRQEFLRKTRS